MSDKHLKTEYDHKAKILQSIDPAKEAVRAAQAALDKLRFAPAEAEAEKKLEIKTRQQRTLDAQQAIKEAERAVLSTALVFARANQKAIEERYKAKLAKAASDEAFNSRTKQQTRIDLHLADVAAREKASEASQTAAIAHKDAIEARRALSKAKKQAKSLAKTQAADIKKAIQGIDDYTDKLLSEAPQELKDAIAAAQCTLSASNEILDSLRVSAIGDKPAAEAKDAQKKLKLLNIKFQIIISVKDSLEARAAHEANH